MPGIRITKFSQHMNGPKKVLTFNWGPRFILYCYLFVLYPDWHWEEFN